MKDHPKPITIPRWYQDLSISQVFRRYLTTVKSRFTNHIVFASSDSANATKMQKVFELGDIMRADYAERVTERTRRALGDIGVTSTFVRITSEQIRELRRLTDLDPVKFLSEIYRIVAGRYFTDEEYKKVYDCNERIILSAIAFLTLPEIVVELHRRIPMGEAQKFPPKPMAQKIPPRRRSTSPYLEPPFVRPDHRSYKQQLNLWRQRCQSIGVPRAILPPWIKHSASVELPTIVESERIVKKNYRTARVTSPAAKTPERILVGKPRGRNKDVALFGHENKSREIAEKESVDPRLDRPKTHSEESSTLTEKESHDYYKRQDIGDPSSMGERETHSTTLDSGDDYSRQRRSYKTPHMTEKYTQSAVAAGTKRKANNERLDYSKGWHSEKNTWLAEKDTHLIVTGLSENVFCPISYETSGLACVTPDNSDESFFAELNHVDGRKTYPRGRENLSRNWQEWLRAVDEEFIKVKNNADKIIDSIKDTLRLVGPEISCDICCSCRQTRKANINYHTTKTPCAVIDCVAVDGTKNMCIVGSLLMNSPAPSGSGSDDNLPDVIASHDQIVKNKVISVVANEKSETTYYISEVSKQMEHIPRGKVARNSSHQKRIKNVPPCGCAIEKMINEGSTTVTSGDDILGTRNNAPCIGKKYRPKVNGACQEHPSNKLCGRNPLKKKVYEKIRESLRAKKISDEDEDEEEEDPEERNMYSMATFQPCGNEDGMAVCGGPWGALNVPDAEALARREAEAKFILRSPPCGEKPGRAVCGAPFGTHHPLPKKPKNPKKNVDEDEEEEEEEEEEVEEKQELNERKKREREERRKKAQEEEKVEGVPNRDERCSTVAEHNRGANKSAAPAAAPPRATGKMEKHLSTKNARSNKRKKSSGEFRGEYKSETESGGKHRYSRNESTKGRKRLSGESKGKRREIDADEEYFFRRTQTKELNDRWNRMKRLLSKFVTSPIVLPNESPRMCKREDIRDRCGHSEGNTRLSEGASMGKGPFGRRTKSEEALPAEKTLVYLVKPEEPLETVPLRLGGKPCECRENRNKKKTLLYNVSALVPKGKGNNSRDRVIEGLIYITPTPSVRNSDDYVPVYELYDSPYEMCIRERKDENFGYMERYLGPGSLIVNKSPAVRCDCFSTRPKILDDRANTTLKENEKESIIKEPVLFPEEKWDRTFDDKDLVNFHARCRDNVPCWLRCIEFSKDGCCVFPKVLRVKRPICECRYERKIVKREEEKANWLRREEKAKTIRKQPYSRVAGLSRHMRTETNVMISNVTRTRREEEGIDDIEYCVSAVAQDHVMGPAERILSGLGMHTPLITPETSKLEIPIAKLHSYWSPMNPRAAAAYPPTRDDCYDFSRMNPQARATARVDEENLRPGYKNETDCTNKFIENPNKRVDVLFPSAGQGNILNTSRLAKKKPACTVVKDGKSKKGCKGKETKADKLPSVQPTPRRPREFHIAHSIDAESGKKTSATLDAQQSYRSETADAVNEESKKKSSTKGLGRNYKSNVLAPKSTGNITKRTTSDLLDRKKETSGKINLAKLLQIELEKMAGEGFLFAKLPACHQMPQLQYWIMYRKGIAFTPEEKKKLMSQSIKIWKNMEKSKPKKIESPAIEMTEEALENLTYDSAEEIKRDVASKKATFYSRVRNLRVLQTRAMWNLMEFGKFPGVSFKKAYFTYQAEKEADGFVFRPWARK